MEPGYDDTSAWHPPAGEEPAGATRPPAASLTKNGMVKLKHVPYEEVVRVITSLTHEVGAFVGKSSRLTPEMSESWGSLAMLHDTWEYQVAPHQRRPPGSMTLTISRCEALVLWKLWAYMPLQPHQAPGWAQTMEELHKLLQSG